MTKLSTRFLVYYAVTYLVLIGVMGVFVDRTSRSQLLADVVDDLEVAARLASDSLPEETGGYERWAADVFAATGYRATLIRLDGVVVADSHLDPEGMQNHGSREEVVEALTGDVGTARRVSASSGFEQLYVALPPEADLIVRTSVPTRVIDDELAAVRQPILIIGVIVGLVGVVVMAVLARRLAKPITELTAQAARLVDGGESSPRRSRVYELDQLGVAVSTLANRLGTRVVDAEAATETLQNVLGAMSQGTILIDEEDRVEYANPSAYTILGAVPDLLSGLAPLQLQTAVRAARLSREQQVRVVDHGNPTRRIRAVATPFTGNGRVLILIIDVTERERTDSIRRDFVANASHELKTPVATIIASSEALQIALDRGDGSADGFAVRIEESARQLDSLVGDLLDLSRLERELPEMSLIRLDLLAQDEIERMRPDLDAKNLAVDMDVTPVSVLGSHRDLSTAVRNLLDNAIRHTMSGGSIGVGLQNVAGHAVLTVSDTGEGIPIRDIDRIFERFYRVDSARARATGGTGLGLAIVKHVAETHGGSVTVESELGVGSRFTVRVPNIDEGSISNGH